MIDNKKVLFVDVDFFSDNGSKVVPEPGTLMEFITEINRLVSLEPDLEIILVGSNEVIRNYRYNNKKQFCALKRSLSEFGFGRNLHEVLYIEGTTEGFCRATSLWEGCCKWIKEVSLPKEVYMAKLLSPKVLMEWERFVGGNKECK